MSITIQKSTVVLPEETHITNGVLVTQGEILELKRLRVDESGVFNVYPEASLNTKVPSGMKLESLHVFTGGVFQQSLGDLTVGKLNVTLINDLVVNAYGKMDVSGISVQVRGIILNILQNVAANFNKLIYIIFNNIVTNV